MVIIGEAKMPWTTRRESKGPMEANEARILGIMEDDWREKRVLEDGPCSDDGEGTVGLRKLFFGNQRMARLLKNCGNKCRREIA
jgi:hypothetical protein